MAARASGARSAEMRVLRRTRLRLVAWSAGSTFVVLVAMGAVLYAATARFLAVDGEAILRARADTFLMPAVMVTTGGSAVEGPVPTSGSIHAPAAEGQVVVVTGGMGSEGVIEVTPAGLEPLIVDPEGATGMLAVSTDPSKAGVLVGGGALSGTIAMVFDGEAPIPFQLLDASGFATALAGSTVINEATFEGSQMRVLSLPIPGATESQVIQVAADRTAELRTLEGLAMVLGAAGAVAVAVAAAFGWIYAGRALVPVRESLRRQREFAADASHELRTPLAVIRGNLELLRARRGPASSGPPATTAPPATEIDPDPLDEIDAEVDRLSGLVDQLLLLARADSDALELERRPADLGAEAADALDALTTVAAARGVELALDVEPVPVSGDPERLRQLATILIDNAIRHAPRGGHVEVSAHARDGHAVLRVTDDGPGIRAGDLPHVFDRFWRAADAPAGGSGLGLAIAAWITEQHDGSIAAGNAPDGGARFEVRLPLG